jgi:hypothetical protein
MIPILKSAGIWKSFVRVTSAKGASVMSEVTLPQDANEMARVQSIAATRTRDNAFLNISMFLLKFWSALVAGYGPFFIYKSRSFYKSK